VEKDFNKFKNLPRVTCRLRSPGSIESAHKSIDTEQNTSET
jgi:hypothetical protein